MAQTTLKLVKDSAPRPIGAPRSAEQILVDEGALDPGDLLRAQVMVQRQEVTLPDVLRVHRMVPPEALTDALARSVGAERIDLAKQSPDPRLVDLLGADFCTRHQVLPVVRVGAVTLVVCADPASFEAHRPVLEAGLGALRMGVAAPEDIQAALDRLRRRRMAAMAETRVAEADSCRTWGAGRARLWALGAIAVWLGLLVASPVAAFWVLAGWGVITLGLLAVLRAIAAVVFHRSKTRMQVAPEALGATPMRRLPTVSILVPLFREREITGKLLERLQRLHYPRELLDVCLVVEEDDTLTQATIAATKLPAWMRQVVVPRGKIQTKPRAMNYALDFCRGSIVGIYDAEDAPEPDQIHKIVRAFHEAPPEVACLQGVLDFYNTHTNWMSRCFTIEYASWWRVILPGFVRMGLVIPLGGTTLFFRRAALEEMGRWDAHNVTEDADLGIRLARHGYRTELVDTTTFEEANCHVWPWIKQRSRWLKGYAMTYAVHMRQPMRLLQDLGWRKFLGVQLLFLGTLSQFALVPVLWSFWLLTLGVAPPIAQSVPWELLLAIGALFLVAEVINISIGVLAISGLDRGRLKYWVPTTHVYFPLGAVAIYKAFFEMLTRPFYWDKTNHGTTVGRATGA